MEGSKGGHFEVIKAGSTSCFSLPPFLTISPQLIVGRQNMIGQAHIPDGFSSPPWGSECPLELRVKIKHCSPELYSIRTTGKSLTYMGPQDWTLVLALVSQTSGCLSVSPVSYLNCQWVKSCSSGVNRCLDGQTIDPGLGSLTARWHDFSKEKMPEDSFKNR